MHERDKIMMHNVIGDNIKALRNQGKMKQQQLADKLCITRQALSNYETGKRIPDIYILSDLADVFDVTIDFLIGRENK